MAASTGPRKHRLRDFITVPGDRHSEVGRTLAEPVPQALSLIDQLGLWGNLGVSLLGFTGAIFVLQPDGPGTPELSLAAALTAIVVGTVLGTLPLALAGLPGARTGAPAMVLLRGLFGAELSYLPTALNILQCLGWGMFELVTIATAAHTVAPALPRWCYVLIAGAVTGAARRPPARRHPHPAQVRHGRRGDRAGLPVHPAPPAPTARVHARHLVGLLGGDRHRGGRGDLVRAAGRRLHPALAHPARPAFAGTIVGYGVTQILCYVIGLLALLTVAHGNPNDIYGAFIALPAGALGFAVLAARELDQSFANVYSTAVSIQNLRPLWDRRVLAVVIAAVTTAGALWAQHRRLRELPRSCSARCSCRCPRCSSSTSSSSPGAAGTCPAPPRSRWPMLVPWAAGFVTYQLINPGYVSWWVSAWAWIARQIGFTPASWMSASILSFVVAALVTLLVGGLRAVVRGHRQDLKNS